MTRTFIQIRDIVRREARKAFYIVRGRSFSLTEIVVVRGKLEEKFAASRFLALPRLITILSLGGDFFYLVLYKMRKRKTGRDVKESESVKEDEELQRRRSKDTICLSRASFFFWPEFCYYFVSPRSGRSHRFASCVVLLCFIYEDVFFFLMAP